MSRKQINIPQNLFNPEEFYLMEEHTPSFSCVSFSKTLKDAPPSQANEDLNLSFGELKVVDDKFWVNVTGITVTSKDKTSSRTYLHYSEAEKEEEISKRKEQE